MIIKSNRNKMERPQKIEAVAQPKIVAATTHKIERVQPKVKPLEKQVKVEEVQIKHKKNTIKEEKLLANESFKDFNDEKISLLDEYLEEKIIGE